MKQNTRKLGIMTPFGISPLGFGFALMIMTLPGISSCGGAGGLSKMPGAVAGCPDISDVSAIAKLDFASEFGFDVETAAKVKSSLSAAVEVSKLSASIEGDLKTACTNFAKDLGIEVKGNDAKSACQAVAKGIGDLKAKAGGSFSLKIVPPVCGASLTAMADCAANCDANLEPGQVEVKCEGGELSGKCGGICEGKCDVSVGGVCSGTCQGSCEAGFKGTCSGDCEGKCNGKDIKGKCTGTCEGKCHAGAEGTCSGKCKGNCDMKAGASCEGTCTGNCSVQFEAPTCTGEVKPPQMSAECKAQCDASVTADISCTPATVALEANGAVDAEAVAKLQAAFEANLPAVLNIAFGMKDKLVDVAATSEGIIRGGFDLATKAPNLDATAAGKVTACLAAPFTAAIEAAGNISANVTVSVDVQASASAKAGT